MVIKKLFSLTDKSELYAQALKFFLLVKGKKLQKKHEMVLRHLVQYGVSDETFEMLLREKKVPSLQSISNAKTMLSAEGLLAYSPLRLSGGLEDFNIEKGIDFVIRCKLQEE